MYSNYWHCDPHPIDSIKLFVLLNDVNEENGPFHYLNESDTNKLAKGFNRKSDGVPGEKVEQHSNTKTLTGKAGRAMLFNTNRLLHRAGNPEPDNPRDMLLIQFIPSIHNTTSDDWRTRAKKGVAHVE